MSIRKSIFQVVCLILCFIAVVYVFTLFSYKSKVVLNGKTYLVEVVDTKKLLEKGLSGHKPLNSNEGMLFIFQKPAKEGFWMKDMSFPIDIIWMDQNWKIIQIENSVGPETYPKIFYPESDSLYVIELKSGEAQANGIKLGLVGKFIGK